MNLSQTKITTGFDETSQKTAATQSRRVVQLPLFLFLSLKEIWRNKGRFAMVAAVVALITTLVLFIAGLTEGLGNGNREYIENLDAELVVFQENVDLLVNASRLSRSTARQIRRLDGIVDAGPIAFSNASLFQGENEELYKVSLIGVDPGRPGEPAIIEGSPLSGKNDNEALIDINVAQQAGYSVGDTLIIKSTLGVDEEFYEVRVAGITEGQKYFIQPSIILPYQTWNEIRPRSRTEGVNQTTFNVIAVKLANPSQEAEMAAEIENFVGKIEAVDIVTTYEAAPGYQEQQSTLDTQRGFTLVIGLLVIGGFFQIQTLQKVGQVGMLKAIGASNVTVILAAVSQIISLNTLGVILGALGTLALGLALPSNIPIIFEQEVVLSAVASLLLIGPIGGLLSLRTLLKAEPLTSLGLTA